MKTKGEKNKSVANFKRFPCENILRLNQSKTLNFVIYGIIFFI